MNKFRVWDENKQEYEKHPVLLAPSGTLHHAISGVCSVQISEPRHKVEWCSDIPDKNGDLIYENDVISLETADHEQITVVCKFGKVQRQIFENLVEITGFYFVRSNDGRKTFPIVNNYLGVHDSELYEIIGTIHDKEGEQK